MGIFTNGRGSNPERCFTDDYAGAQTNQVIITPTTGKAIQIISVYASTAVNNVDVTIDFTTSGNLIFKLYTANRGGATGNVICATGAINETIELTCGAGTFISIAYNEV